MSDKPKTLHEQMELAERLDLIMPEEEEGADHAPPS